MVSRARDFGVYFQSNLHTNHLGYRRLSLTQTKLIPSSSRLCLTTKAKAPTKGALIHVSLVISLPTSFTHIYNTSNTTLPHTLHSSTIITKAPRYTYKQHKPATHNPRRLPNLQLIRKPLRSTFPQHVCASQPTIKPTTPHLPGDFPK